MNNNTIQLGLEDFYSEPKEKALVYFICHYCGPLPKPEKNVFDQAFDIFFSNKMEHYKHLGGIKTFIGALSMAIFNYTLARKNIEDLCNIQKVLEDCYSKLKKFEPEENEINESELKSIIDTLSANIEKVSSIVGEVPLYELEMRYNKNYDKIHFWRGFITTNDSNKHIAIEDVTAKFFNIDVSSSISNDVVDDSINFIGYLYDVFEFRSQLSPSFKLRQFCRSKSALESKWDENMKGKFYLLKSGLLKTRENKDYTNVKDIICFLQTKLETIKSALSTKNENIISAYMEQELKEKITLVNGQSEVDYVNKLYKPEEEFWIGFMQVNGVIKPEINQVISDFVRLDTVKPDLETADKAVRFISYVLEALKNQKEKSESVGKELSDIKSKFEYLYRNLVNTSKEKNYSAIDQIISFVKKFGQTMISPIYKAKSVDEKQEMLDRLHISVLKADSMFAFKELKLKLGDIAPKQEKFDKDKDLDKSDSDDECIIV